MDRNESARRGALEDLVRLRVPVADAVEQLTAFPWDSDRIYVTIMRADAERVLDAFLDGQLVAAQVSEWADAIECRDGIGFEADHETVSQDFIFAVANPDLDGQLSRDVAWHWKAALRA